MSMRDQKLLAFAPHFKIQAHRLIAKVSYIDRHLEQVVESGCVMEVTLQMDARQPDVEFVKHDAVRQADSTKQFSLGEFKEAYVGAVENYAGGIYVAPAHALLNGVFVWLRHKTTSRDKPLHRSRSDPSHPLPQTVLTRNDHGEILKTPLAIVR